MFGRNKYYELRLMQLSQQVGEAQILISKQSDIMLTMVRYIDDMEYKMFGEERRLLENKILQLWGKLDEMS